MQLSTTYISGDHSKFVAPPSVDLRAVGEIVFTRPETVTDPLVSGTVVRGKVTERFDQSNFGVSPGRPVAEITF